MADDTDKGWLDALDELAGKPWEELGISREQWIHEFYAGLAADVEFDREIAAEWSVCDADGLGREEIE